MSQAILGAIDELQKRTLDRLGEVEAKQYEFAKELHAIRQNPVGRGDMPLEGRATPGGLAVVRKMEESAEFRAFLEGKTRSAGIPLSAGMLLTKNTLTSGDGGTYSAPQRQAGTVTGPVRRVWITDLIPTLATTAGAVEFNRETGFTNSSATVAEAALKPESTVTVEVLTTQVRTIAHWLKLSRQVMADAPALTQHVSARLLYGLRLRLEEQVIAGNGSGTNLSGLLQSGNFTAHTPVANDTALDTLRRARAELEAADFVVDAFVLHPRDVAAIDLLKETGGAYVVGDPNASGADTLWGIPIVSTPAITQGKFIAAAFAQSAMLFMRDDAKVEVGYEGEDFVRNLSTILAELRAAFAVMLPAGIRSGSLVTA